MHKGGWVDATLRSGLISWHGGGRLAVLHGGGTPAAWPELLDGEVASILRRNEFVVREQAVTPATLPWLERLNQTGQLPEVAISLDTAGPARGVSIGQIHATLQVMGDVRGDDSSLARVQEAWAEAVQDGVLRALRTGSENGAPVIHINGVYGQGRGY